MSITLYDLCGQDDRRFSPFCWRTKYALAHKGLAFETVPVSFSAIKTIGDGFAIFSSDEVTRIEIRNYFLVKQQRIFRCHNLDRHLFQVFGAILARNNNRNAAITFLAAI